MQEIRAPQSLTWCLGRSRVRAYDILLQATQSLLLVTFQDMGFDLKYKCQQSLKLTGSKPQGYVVHLHTLAYKAHQISQSLKLTGSGLQSSIIYTLAYQGSSFPREEPRKTICGKTVVRSQVACGSLSKPNNLHVTLHGVLPVQNGFQSHPLDGDPSLWRRT